MGYDEAVAYLDALGVDAMKAMRPATQRIESICEALNHPERSVPAIHITGTNGKTSTARIAASLLSATGLSVATYTSPHLQSVRERLVLGGDPIPRSDFGDVFDRIRPFVELVEGRLGERLTYFEILTAMFFEWAAEAADALVVEVGLGGRWDATNQVPAPVAVITNVGLDHTGMLGSDRPTIAKEKAGIIKPGALVVTGERTPDVLDVISDEASGVGASMLRLDKDFRLVENRLALGGRYLSLHTTAHSYEGLFLPAHGAHQGVNAAIAIQAVTSFLGDRFLAKEIVAEGLERVSVPGRLEQVPANETKPSIILDVAHNPDGMSALVAGLLEAFVFEQVTFVIGILADKDYLGMLSELTRLDCRVIVTAAKSVRSVPVEDLKIAAEELGIECRIVEDVSAAVDTAVGDTDPGELVCVTGSHYVVGEARTHLGLDL